MPKMDASEEEPNNNTKDEQMDGQEGWVFEDGTTESVIMVIKQGAQKQMKRG